LNGGFNLKTAVLYFGLTTTDGRHDHGGPLGMFTHGRIRAINAERGKFGLNRLSSRAPENGTFTANDLGQTMFDSVKSFAEGSPDMDDPTFAVIKGTSVRHASDNT
jgi:hypothetical protein